jgi:hypothetical protein
MDKRIFGDRKAGLIVILCGALVVGCAGGPLTTREKAAGVGTLGGAAAGAAIGSAVDRPGTGALIGGAVGLGVGALIGDQLQAQERAQQQPLPVVIERDRPPEVVPLERTRAASYAKIPPGHLPPPGKCRVWFPDRPPGHQPPPRDCHTLERQVPPGAYLLYGN